MDYGAPRCISYFLRRVEKLCRSKVMVGEARGHPVHILCKFNISRYNVRGVINKGLTNCKITIEIIFKR